MNLPDVDIDFGDRERVLELIHGVPARLNTERKHNTGVYFTRIPVASDGMATMDYKTAEQLGYFKLDLLNVNVYENVTDEQHLQQLLERDAPWHRIWEEPEFCKRVIHIGNYHHLAATMKPDSIPRMAMFLSVIRPAKAHLQNKPWKEIAESVWETPEDGSYAFKKAHAVSYAHLVKIHINLLDLTD